LQFDSVDGFGRTPLHWAYNNEQLELADQLVLSGASAGVKDYQGLRPFELPRKRLPNEDDEG
jgi:ankyrin repeat protein